MDYFDYEYEEVDEICSFNSHLNTTNKIDMDIEYPILYNIKNDLEELNFKNYIYPIKIKNLSETELNIFIFNHKNQVKGEWKLKFNHKYPFEPPFVEYVGPKYEFYDTILLSYDIQLFHQDKWSIQESLHSILLYFIDILYEKTPICHKMSWNESDTILLEWLHEINFFKNKSYFEEFKEKTLKGQGIGYSTSSTVTTTYDSFTNIKKKKDTLWKNIKELYTNEHLESLFQTLNVSSYLSKYIEKSSYLHSYEMKEYFLFFNPLISMDKLHIESMLKFINDSSYSILFENVESHFYYKKYENNMCPNFQQLIKRIIIDLCDLNVYIKEFESIFYAWSIEFPQFLKLLIKSNNEPYIGGYFEFDIYIPNDYPQTPPECKLMTTGFGKIRYNPNLYADGKVCLSLLGTWNGEPWNPNYNNLTHIVQAISVMILTDQPIQNEPAYSSSVYYDININHFENMNHHLWMVKKYKLQIKYWVIRFSLLHLLEDKSSIFISFIEQDYKKHQEDILKSIQIYIDIVSDPFLFQNITNATDFQANSICWNTLQSDLKEMKEKLEKFF